jgi:hypothetical protein
VLGIYLRNTVDDFCNVKERIGDVPDFRFQNWARSNSHSSIRPYLIASKDAKLLQEDQDEWLRLSLTGVLNVPCSPDAKGILGVNKTPTRRAKRYYRKILDMQICNERGLNHH